MKKDSGKKYNWSAELGDYEIDKETTTTHQKGQDRNKSMNKDVEKNYNWSVESGDYERDKEATATYQRKKDRKKKMKLFFSILLYICVVSLITYFILRNF